MFPLVGGSDTTGIRPQLELKCMHGLCKIQRDILQALDSGRVAALVLLDLSAAFDTIDHSILTERLNKSFGISGDALIWIISYLRQRNQRVVTGNTPSADVTIEYGVSQESVLGPKLYSLYTKPLGYVIRHHQLYNYALLCR